MSELETISQAFMKRFLKSSHLLVAFILTVKEQRDLFRDLSVVVPPSPIPNLEVKRYSADGTIAARLWESRPSRGNPFFFLTHSLDLRDVSHPEFRIRASLMFRIVSLPQDNLSPHVGIRLSNRCGTSSKPRATGSLLLYSLCSPEASSAEALCMELRSLERGSSPL